MKGKILGIVFVFVAITLAITSLSVFAKENAPTPTPTKIPVAMRTRTPPPEYYNEKGQMMGEEYAKYNKIRLEAQAFPDYSNARGGRGVLRPWLWKKDKRGEIVNTEYKMDWVNSPYKIYPTPTPKIAKAQPTPTSTPSWYDDVAVNK